MKTLMLSMILLAGALSVAAAGPSLAGTKWQFDETQTVVEFLAGGQVRFDNPSFQATGSWRLEGDKLTFDCNKYTLYQVTVHGDTMSGVWRRVKGSDPSETSPSMLTRIPAGASARPVKQAGEVLCPPAGCR